MNHLVERLREGEDGLEYAAADEIEELEDRITALEAALETGADENEDQAAHIAELKAALEEAADEIERLREALWQCGFWARNAEADDKMARLKIAHEAEKILSPEYWAFKREDDIAERWED